MRVPPNFFFEKVFFRNTLMSTLIHAFCCSGNEIATEQRPKFHFWARLSFSMVVKEEYILPVSKLKKFDLRRGFL